MMRVLAGLSLLGAASACGVLVHNEVFQRSADVFTLPTSNDDISAHQGVFSRLLKIHTESVQAGAFFPDWGYQCLNTNDDAEAAHWPPFLIASVEHINSRYGSLTSKQRTPEEQEHLEKLIGFVFAVANHQVADATWHAIRLPTGFLSALAGVDFDGDEAAAHRVLDLGGDVILSSRIARNGEDGRVWIGDKWWVPVEDLVAIYSRIGRDVSSFVMRYCTMRGLAALRSGYDTVASDSPMLTAELDGYYLGGINEMAARSVSCWANLTKWIAFGIDREEKLMNGWGICDVFRAIQARGGAGSSLHGKHREGKMTNERMKKYPGGITFTKDQFGAESYHIPGMYTPSVEKPKPLKPSQDAPKLGDPTYITANKFYSHFGTSLSIGEFSPFDDGQAIAVGAPWESIDSSKPGEGGVYILSLKEFANSTLRSVPGPLRLARQPTASTDQRFGISSTPWRMMNTTFLAVAAAGPLTYDPSTPPSLPFQGTSPAGKVHIFPKGSGSSLFSITFKGAELGSIGRRWWGETMLSADLAGDGEEKLIVSGSRSDGLRICEGRGKVQFGEGEIAIISPPQSFSSPSSDQSIHVESSEDQSLTLTATILSLPESAKTTPCSKTSTYENFGTATTFSVHSRTLFVSAPGTSSVFAYRWNSEPSSLEHVYTIPAPRAPRPLSASSPSSRSSFGAAMIAGSTSGVEWLAISATDEDVDGVKQSGIVRLYTLSETAAELVAEVVPEKAEAEWARFGTVLAKDGDNGLWIGSEFWDAGRGAVWWVDVGRIYGGERLSGRAQIVLKEQEGAVEKISLNPVRIGQEANARFATSIASGANGELIVGIPRAGVTRPLQNERFFGYVAFFWRV
ncbi:hypothetical protein C7212DRAFT_278597 [Tuber magnatum]|uniref:Phospholipase C/D domain-containing protein n=1 Tax=Tuber magnatum TaxID=42249 RepID=A0A317SSH1_9PEZI|nr:hypothetical protein C7212DRAFT_278597 [Tuber magnatum]